MSFQGQTAAKWSACGACWSLVERLFIEDEDDRESRRGCLQFVTLNPKALVAQAYFFSDRWGTPAPCGWRKAILVVLICGLQRIRVHELAANPCQHSGPGKVRNRERPTKSGRSAAWLAHQTGGLGVAGSNPAVPTTL